MNEISDMAERYAKISQMDKDQRREHRNEVLDIVIKCRSFAPKQIAYFCQQMASWLPHNVICIELTIFTNRLIDME